MTRKLDIRISAASEEGFIAWEAGEPIAAFANPQELAMWVERKAMSVEGEAERMRSDLEQTAPPKIVKAMWGKR